MSDNETCEKKSLVFADIFELANAAVAGECEGMKVFTVTLFGEPWRVAAPNHARAKRAIIDLACENMTIEPLSDRELYQAIADMAKESE